MSEKDREKVGCGDGDTYIVSEYSVGYQAALAHSAAALAEKDAEIEGLKDIGNTLASSLHVASDEIARLQRVITEAWTHLNNEPSPRSYHVANAITWIESAQQESL